MSEGIIMVDQSGRIAIANPVAEQLFAYEKNSLLGLTLEKLQLIVYAAELEKEVELRTEALNNSIAKLEQEILERKKTEEEVRKSLERDRELNERSQNSYPSLLMNSARHSARY